jgi:hypothetical protein
MENFDKVNKMKKQIIPDHYRNMSGVSASIDISIDGDGEDVD